MTARTAREHLNDATYALAAGDRQGALDALSLCRDKLSEGTAAYGSATALISRVGAGVLPGRAEMNTLSAPIRKED